MKVCHLCGDTYSDHVDFCFNDGEVLALGGVVGLANGQAAPAVTGAEADGSDRRVQGAQGAWSDGTPVPVPRSSNRQGPVPDPSAATEDGAPAEPEPDHGDTPLDAPVPAVNLPRSGVPASEGPPLEPAGAREGSGSAADAGAGAVRVGALEALTADPPSIVVPAPSIKATPAPALQQPALSTLSSQSQAATPIMAEPRGMTPASGATEVRGTPDARARVAPPEQRPPVPVDAELAATRAPDARPKVTPPLQPPKRSPPPNVRVVSGADNDNSNLLWLGAMFAVGVLFALVGGSIPLLYMVYTGGWGSTTNGDNVSSGTRDVPAPAAPAPEPDLPVPVALTPEPESESATTLSPTEQPGQMTMRFLISPSSKVNIDVVEGTSFDGTPLKARRIGTTRSNDEHYDIEPARQVTFRFSSDNCTPKYVTWPASAAPADSVNVVQAGLSCSRVAPVPAPAPEDPVWRGTEPVPPPVPSAVPAPLPAVPAPAAPQARVDVNVMVVGTTSGVLFIDGMAAGTTPNTLKLVPGPHTCGFGIGSTPDPAYFQACVVVAGKPLVLKKQNP